MYEQFHLINGEHPWREVSAEGYIDYLARYRKGGKIIYFNFSLARELGLLASNHPSRMNKKLEQHVLRTFSLQIVNEYDHLNHPKIVRKSLKGRAYMATRYLQLQHENKQGKTSGDGRSLWNGWISNDGKIFDLSSCGTGATLLSPGSQDADRPIQTGDESFGYGCGRADLDEMLASAIMSEIFYREGIPTERVLCVIAFDDKTAIGVRSAPNLIRPAHMFRYLKMGLHGDLKASIDYFMKRQEKNRSAKFEPSGKKRYQDCLEYLTRNYAKLAAVLEEEYIFNWMAWDGDNMLAHGALLDYGSIRQFAAKHNKYRYEDTDRFSTNLSEQKYWAKKIIQTFAQLMDFVITSEKKPLDAFDDAPCLVLFDESFRVERLKRMLWGIGFDFSHIESLIQNHEEDVTSFQKNLDYFESIKTIKGEAKTADGIDHPPIFLVRHLLKELPRYILKEMKNGDWPHMPAEPFCELMSASYAQDKDLELTKTREEKAAAFQKNYQKLIVDLNPENPKEILAVVARRSSVINYEYRRTGDGLTWIVNEALKPRFRRNRNKLQEAIERFIESQILIPGKWKPIREEELKGNSLKARLLRSIQKKLEIYHENI